MANSSNKVKVSELSLIPDANISDDDVLLITDNNGNDRTSKKIDMHQLSQYACTHSIYTSIAYADGTAVLAYITDTHKVKNAADIASIRLGNAVETIASSTFEYCSQLSSIVIPDSVSEIGAAAFYCCTGISSISLPKSVDDIGPDAFFGCISLAAVDAPGMTTAYVADNAGSWKLGVASDGSSFPVEVRCQDGTITINSSEQQ